MTSSLCAYFWTQRGIGSEAGVLSHVLQLLSRPDSDAPLLPSWLTWPLGVQQAWGSPQLPAQRHQWVRHSGQADERMSWKSALCLCPPPCVLCLGLAPLLAAQWLQRVQNFHSSPHQPAWKSHLGALRDQKGGWDMYPSGQGHHLSCLRDSHPASSPSLGSGCGSAEVVLEMETGSPSPCALGEDLPLTSLFFFFFFL